jgi:hypothetical protein
MESQGRTNRIIGSFERSLLAVTFVVVLIVAVFVHSQSGGKWTDWFEPKAVLSFLGIAIGFLFLHWQLEMQSENAMKANRQQAADKLKLEIYDKIAQRIEATRVPLGKIVNAPRFFVLHLKGVVASGARPSDVAESAFPKHDLWNILNQLSDTVLSLMAAIEIYEIVLSEFAVFRTKLAEQLQSTTKESSQFVLDTTGLVRKEGFGPYVWPPDFAALDTRADKILELGMDLMGTIEDLRVEALNHLISPIFPGRRASARQPGDPKIQVISISSLE